MASSSLHLPLQHIRQVFSWGKLFVNHIKSARHYSRGNKQRWGISCGFPNSHTSKYLWRTDKRITDRSTSIGQCKCGVCGVKPQRRTEWTPCVGDDIWRIHVTDGLSICASAQPRQVLTNNGNCPRASARNWKVSKNQALFRRYTAVDRAIKTKIVMAVEPAFCPHWWNS